MTDATTLDPGDFEEHPHRRALLDELHARPFQAMSTPTRLMRFGFLTDARQAETARLDFAALCAAHGAVAPRPGAKHHVARLGEIDLAFEQHGEFTTYTFILRGEGAAPFEPDSGARARRLPALGKPGAHLVSIDLCLAAVEATDFERWFDPTSLAAADVKNGAATMATDFRPTADGFIRILVADRALSVNAAGALCQRLLEIETYRMLAMLGLPEAQRLTPRTARMEEELTRVAQETTKSGGLADDSGLLRRLTLLAAELEADTSASAYRFGASRAYDEIIRQRLQAIGEEPRAQYPTFGSFRARRGAPAMRTILTIERRQHALSEKVTRATQLLRSRIDVAIEEQNGQLLAAMNDRARMQLRLQQTVEGLSVAAISYYVVGLAGYVFKAMKDAGAPIDPNIAMGAAVPLSILGVWWVVRRIRRSHSEH
ncbi:MAG: DUF3422 domain-containing protein [Methylobacteriaceae bacterium]|nr:DUF3422 domain-containing protein [Methylobacteriaceae bacterium]